MHNFRNYNLPTQISVFLNFTITNNNIYKFPEAQVGNIQKLRRSYKIKAFLDYKTQWSKYHQNGFGL
jgi:hypothetical protein